MIQKLVTKLSVKVIRSLIFSFSGRKYNAERAKAAEVTSKRKRLKKIEEARRKQRKSEIP